MAIEDRQISTVNGNLLFDDGWCLKTLHPAHFDAIGMFDPKSMRRGFRDGA